MNAQIAIRPAQASDAAPVAALMRSSFVATYPTFETLHSADGDRNFVEHQLIPKTTVKIATTADMMVGFIAYTTDEIDQLYLHPDWHRRQIGTRLLACAKENADRLTLWTFAINTGARAFYAHHGFREIAQTSGDNEQNEPDVQLEWVRT